MARDRSTFLWMGTTEACLQQAGSCPMHRDALKSKVREGARWCVQVLSRCGGMLSDPVALLELMDSSSRWTSVTDTARSARSALACAGPRGIGQGLWLSVFVTKDANAVVSSEVDTGRGVWMGFLPSSEFSTFQCSRGLSLDEWKRCR